MKREEENSNGVDVGSNSKFPLSFWEVTAASTVVVGFLFGLLGVYLTMPASDYSFLKLPRNLEDLQILRQNLSLSLSLTLFSAKITTLFYFIFFGLNTI